MEKDFKRKYQELIEPTSDIDIAMYGFGIWSGNKIFLRGKLGLHNPIRDKLQLEWDNYIWLDSIGADDKDETLDKLYTLLGVDYPLYQIEKAIKFNRPSWVFFYFAGHVLGEKLEGEFTEDEYKIVFNEILKSIAPELRSKLLELEKEFSN